MLKNNKNSSFVFLTLWNVEMVECSTAHIRDPKKSLKNKSIDRVQMRVSKIDQMKAFI